MEFDKCPPGNPRTNQPFVLTRNISMCTLIKVADWKITSAYDWVPGREE